MANSSTSAGTYRIAGNTLSLRFENGGVTRVFTWVFGGDENPGSPKTLRIVTSDYLRK